MNRTAGPAALNEEKEHLSTFYQNPRVTSAGC